MYKGRGQDGGKREKSEEGGFLKAKMVSHRAHRGRNLKHPVTLRTFSIGLQEIHAHH
jgi:hypothetical protein